MIKPFRWMDDSFQVLDQRLLPGEEKWVDIPDAMHAARAIEEMWVRGAPAIGCVAAYGLAIQARLLSEEPAERFLRELMAVKERLAATRPTAVNLFWALERLAAVPWDGDPQAYADRLMDEARAIESEDLESCRAMGRHGAFALPGGRISVMTHCNTGGLATAGYGTALGVIRTLHEQGRLEMVYATETRPRQQGARLTTWELWKEGIPVTLISDTAVAHVMSRGLVQAVVVGADRIASNGDTANKIGTLNLAIIADRYSVPFFIAAPLSTFDPATATGQDIPIEERSSDEVLYVNGAPIAPTQIRALNPAFDVTPSHLIAGIITERGVARHPFSEMIEWKGAD